MKISIFNPSYPPVRCGIGDYNRALASALAGSGHDVTVVTVTRATAPSRNRPRVLPLLGDWSARHYLRALPSIPRPVDLVVCGYPAVVPGRSASLFFLLPALAKLTLGRPRVTLVVHEFVRTEPRARRLLGLALRAADRIVTVTEAERRAIAADHPRISGRIEVAHNAPSIPVSATDPAADARLRSELARGRARSIVHFGHLASPAKGFDDLLEALPATDATLAVVGELTTDEPYHREIADRVRRLGLEDRVRWLGFLDEQRLGRVLRSADAVVLPFRAGAESGYTSLLGALANGAAVVTTRGAENPEWLSHEGTALLTEPSDPAGIAEALRHLFGDPALSARLREGAAGIEFGWAAIVEAVLGRPDPARN